MIGDISSCPRSKTVAGNQEWRHIPSVYLVPNKKFLRVNVSRAELFSIVFLKYHSVQNSLRIQFPFFCCVCVNLWISPVSPPPPQPQVSSLPWFLTFCYTDSENGSNTWRCSARPWVFEESSLVGDWQGDRKRKLVEWLPWVLDMVRNGETGFKQVLL